MRRANNEAKQEIAIGILGQDGHGKSTLASALFALLFQGNIEVEEGFELSVSIGDCREIPGAPFIYETVCRRYSLCYFATHADVVKNLILKWTPLDGAIMVVSAIEGITNQTKQQMRLARAAGIGRRTIYLHFSSKEEVALCSIDRVVERLLAELRKMARGTELPEEKLRKMLVTRVLFRFDSVHDYHGSLDDLFEAVRPAYMIRREKYFAEEASLFADVLAEGQCAGAFAESPAVQSASTLLLATNGLLPYSLSANELGKREDVMERAGRIADMLMDGVRKRERVDDSG